MTYEITYILKPELTNEEQDAVNQKVAGHIATLEGEAQAAERTFSVERGGTDENNLRKFAFPIKHYRQGYYYTIIFDLGTDNLKELDVILQREAEILRFLVVKDFVKLPSLEELSQQEQKAQEATEATEEVSA